MSDKTPSDYFISDTDGYVAKLNGSELKMVTHVHNWTYTASGDTITATCKNCSNNNGNDFSGGSVTIQKPEKTKFNDGKDENAKVESVGWFGKAHPSRMRSRTAMHCRLPCECGHIHGRHYPWQCHCQCDLYH